MGGGDLRLQIHMRPFVIESSKARPCAGLCVCPLVGLSTDRSSGSSIRAHRRGRDPCSACLRLAQCDPLLVTIQRSPALRWSAQAGRAGGPDAAEGGSGQSAALFDIPGELRGVVAAIGGSGVLRLTAATGDGDDTGSVETRAYRTLPVPLHRHDSCGRTIPMPSIVRVNILGRGGLGTITPCPP